MRSINNNDLIHKAIQFILMITSSRIGFLLDDILNYPIDRQNYLLQKIDPNDIIDEEGLLTIVSSILFNHNYLTLIPEDIEVETGQIQDFTDVDILPQYTKKKWNYLVIKFNPMPHKEAILILIREKAFEKFLNVRILKPLIIRLSQEMAFTRINKSIVDKIASNC